MENEKLYELKNCFDNILFYRKQIQLMQRKISLLRKDLLGDN